MKHHDVIVIGAGPGGYVAAIRCAQLGLDTACVDRWLDPAGKPAFGGTCLNVGCIPSKALLDSSHHYHNVTHLLPDHGIVTGPPQLDIGAMMARKDKIVSTLTRGVAGLFRKNKITGYSGSARLRRGKEVELEPVGDGSGEKQLLKADNIILATGSVPMAIRAAPVDGVHIVDNVGALSFDRVPERLGVIGAGVIGVELGSVWGRLGAEVTLLEAMDDFMAAADRDIAREALKSFKGQGLKFEFGAFVTGTEVGNHGVRVAYEQGGDARSLEVDKLIVAVGRRAATDGLHAEEVGIELDDRGRVVIDDFCRTSLDGVYAVGDVVHGPMLAHKASEEGIAVAEQIAGHKVHIDHSHVPWVIYTAPEIAWVGETEAQLKARGAQFRKGTFPYRALGRALGAGETEGMFKLLGDAKTDRLLGAHIVGNNASELISEAVTAMAFSASTEDLARIVHAHPTLSEGMHEAALAVDGRAIHY